jgi:hypothetical protein
MLGGVSQWSSRSAVGHVVEATHDWRVRRDAGGGGKLGIMGVGASAGLDDVWDEAIVAAWAGSTASWKTEIIQHVFPWRCPRRRRLHAQDELHDHHQHNNDHCHHHHHHQHDTHIDLANMNHPSTTRHILFLSYVIGFQIWDCMDLCTVSEALNLSGWGSPSFAESSSEGVKLGLGFGRAWMKDREWGVIGGVVFAGVLCPPFGGDLFMAERPLIGVW